VVAVAVAVAVKVKVKVKVKGGGAEGRKRALWCLLRGKGCEVLRFPSSCISWKQRASFFLLNRKMNARSAHVCLFHRMKKKKKKNHETSKKISIYMFSKSSNTNLHVKGRGF
jgi:hypothetical protein